MKRNLEFLLFIFLTMVIMFGCSALAGSTNSNRNAANSDDQSGQNDQSSGDSPSITPTNTPDQDATYYYDSETEIDSIFILRPGNSSEVTSPLFVTGTSGPTFEQNIVVRLTDIDGNVLAEEAGTISADIGSAGAYMVQLSFTAAAESPGRITVLHYSAMNGAVIHAASVPVKILTGQYDAQTINTNTLEVIEILTPTFSQDLNSGEITVTGNSEYFFESNLSLALCGVGGTGAEHLICGTEDNVLAMNYVMIASPDIGVGGPFSGIISFSVSVETSAVLVVYALSPMDGGIEHLSSVPVTLKP
jgi:hypothetical protein